MVEAIGNGLYGLIAGFASLHWSNPIMIGLGVEVLAPDVGFLLRHLLPGDLFFLGGLFFFSHYRCPPFLPAGKS